jgi:ABC-type sulfate transport system permease component
MDIPFIVAKMNCIDPKINIAELINLFGLPEIVYKENIYNLSGEVTQYSFAYPSIGIFSSTISTSTPVVSDDVNEILRETPQDLHEFITKLGSQKDIEFIDWSYK